jgi:hypothetical protein
MAIYRVQWMFFHPAGTFSAIWYNNQATPPDYGSGGIVDVLTTKMLACMGKSVYLQYIRISPIANFRANRIYSVLKSYPPLGQAGTSIKNSAHPALCIEVPMTDVPQLHPESLHHYRGVPENTITSGVYTSTAEFIGATSSFEAQLVADKWGWLGRSATLAGKATIFTVTQDVNTGIWSFALNSNLFAAPFGQIVQVSISGMTGSAALNGSRQVKTVDATHFTTTHRIPAFPYITGGRVTYSPKELVLPGPGPWPALRVVTRKTGKGFFLSAGHRRAQKVA